MSPTAMWRDLRLSSFFKHAALISFKVFQLNSTSCPQTVARALDSPQKLRIVLKPVVEPVILRFETNQHTRWLATARDYDLLRLSLAKIARQIVLDLGQRNFFHSLICVLREP
jgi:hypothetical protein